MRPFFFGRGYALDPVHAGFGAQDVVGAWVVDLEDRVCERGLRVRERVVADVRRDAAGPGEARTEGRVHGQQGVSE